MKKIICCILVVMAVISCMRKASYEPEEVEDHVILNAQLASGPGPHTIYAGVSMTKTVRHLSEARIACFVNGIHICDAVEDDRGFSVMQTPYRFSADLKAGDVLRLELSSRAGNVSAETDVPYLGGRINNVRTKSKGENMEFTIDVEDISDGQDYYMLTCTHRYERKLQILIAPGEYERREKSFSEGLTLSHSDDPVLDGAYLGSNNDAMDILGTGIPNVFCIMSDKRFTGSGASIRVSAPIEEVFSTSLDYEVYLEGDIVETSHWLDFNLSSITKAEYDYLAALSSLKANDFDPADLLEEAVVPSNVSGGEGFVTVVSENLYTVPVRRK
jgi:hypothetical protein